MVHHLLRAIDSGGETEAGGLLRKLGAEREIARELCYRLFLVSERKNRAQEAVGYNTLVQAWPVLDQIARQHSSPDSPEPDLFG
jgi:putative DNA methylase